MTAGSFAAFFTASALLAVAPGPGMLYVLSRSLAGGRREGIHSSLGTFVGGLVHVFAAGLGLSAILATSAAAYSIVRYAGAAYLVYLGIKMVRAAGHEDVAVAGASSFHAFRQGVLTEVLNPKTAVFFLSFIPQFVDPRAGPAFVQFLVLGVISVSMNTLADLAVVAFSGPLSRGLLGSRKARKRQRIATGCTIAGLGIYVAVRES